MTDFDTLLDDVEGQEPFRVPVRLLLDADAYNRSNLLAVQLEQALSKPADDDVTAVGPVALAEQMAQLKAEHEPTLFVFEQLSAVRWDELTGDHAADEDGLWLAIMAESCVTPEGATVEGFERWKGRLNKGQWETLRQAADQANRGLFDLSPTRAATVLLRGLRQSSTSSTENSGSQDPTG